MDRFSYTDSVHAAFASCFPCFTTSRTNSSLNPANSALSEPSSLLTSAGPSPSSNDLEYLLRDSDSDVLSLHSNIGSAGHRRAKRRRRPKFSLTLFGRTLFGRPPIYLSDDEGDDPASADGGRRRTLATASSSTLDSDATPLDPSTIERIASPDHYAALVSQRESERVRFAEEEARRKAERRARRRERKERERATAFMALNGTSPRSDADTFEGLQGSEDRIDPPFHPGRVILDHPDPGGLRRDDDIDGSNASQFGDDDADLDGELYTRKKKPSVALSASGSDSRSRTSASLSIGDTSHTQSLPTRNTYQSIPYPHTEMHLPPPAKRKTHRTSKRTSIVSSITSQSTSTAPYTPVESIVETPAVDIQEAGYPSFPSTGLSGKRGPQSLDPRAFLVHRG